MNNVAKRVAFYTTLPVVTLIGAADAVFAATFSLSEATVDTIQAGLSSGAVTCTDITQLYLNRIDAYDDQGPSLNAIISTNPNALDIAAELDAAYAAAGPVGSLHCVPVVLTILRTELGGYSPVVKQLSVVDVGFNQSRLQLKHVDK